MNSSPSPDGISRRTFLVGGTALTTATLSIVRPNQVSGATANSQIRLGLIGCGGRGAWIAKHFAEDGHYRLTACSDYFEDRVNTVGEAHAIPRANRFAGLAGYQRLLATDVDAVVIETPPYFHPQQAWDAVEAGKHVFVAKPIAVDVPGCLKIRDAGQRATERKRVFLVDFQTRASEHFRKVLAMVRQGDIGELVLVEAHYPWQGGGRGRPPASTEEKLRSWYYVLELGGDFIVEQSIHALDVATWIIDQDPVRALGTGGRKVRPQESIYDHFAVTYWFPKELVLAFTCIQSIPEVKDEIRARAFGSEGVIDTDYFSGVMVRGKEFYKGAEPNLYTTGTQTNIREFRECIAAGRCENLTVAPSVRSNLTAILGREAAYRRREMTFRDLLKDGRELKFNVKGLKA